jgi:hypothetical protein
MFVTFLAPSVRMSDEAFLGHRKVTSVLDVHTYFHNDVADEGIQRVWDWTRNPDMHVEFFGLCWSLNMNIYKRKEDDGNIYE